MLRALWGLAWAVVGAGVLIALAFLFSFHIGPVQSVPDPPSASQQIPSANLQTLQQDVRTIETTTKDTNSKAADTNHRVRDIQQRLKRCPCGKTAKISRKTITRKPAPRKPAVARPVPQPRQTQPVIQVNVPPTIVVNSNNNTGLPMFPPLPEAANKPGASVILNYNNNPTHISPGTPETPPTVTPSPAPQPRTESESKPRQHKESFWHRLTHAHCDCANEFPPRWGTAGSSYHQ